MFSPTRKPKAPKFENPLHMNAAELVMGGTQRVGKFHATPANLKKPKRV